MALLLAACGLGVYSWLDRESVSVTERTRRENNVFVAWRREALARVELEHGAEKLVLARTLDDSGDASWRMLSPRDEDVDAALVDRFLGTLEFATTVRKVGPNPVAGFDTPRARGTIAMGAITYRFALGPPAPTPEGAAYFRLEGEDPIVVSKELATDLMKGADAFRTRTIVPYLSLDLLKLEVRGKTSAFTLTREKNERSFRIPSRGLRASRDRLDRVWKALAEMRAEAFLPDAEAEKTIVSPEFSIVMTPKDGRPRGEIVVGGPCPGHPNDVVVVRRLPTPTAACAPKGVLEGLGATEASLVDTRLFSLHEDEIEEARLEASPAGAVLDVARKANGWRELAPESRDLSSSESEAATALARDLARAEGEVIGRDEANALHGGLRGRVTVTHAEAGEEESLDLGWEGDLGSVFLRRRADGALLKVSAETVRKLTPGRTRLRSRTLFTEPLAGKPIVSIDTRCAGMTQHVSRDGTAWRLRIDDKEIAPDVAAILDAVDALSRARADAWVADADDGTFGFTEGGGACWMRLAYAQEGGTRAGGLTFGAEGEGGTYARIDGDPAVFVAPRGLRAMVTPLFVERHALVIDPYSVAAIEIVRGKNRKSRDPHAKNDAGLALEDDLAGIVTEAVHLGPPRSGEGFDAPIEVTVRLLPDAGRADIKFTVGVEVERDGERVRLLRVPGIDATLATKSEGVLRVVGGGGAGF